MTSSELFALMTSGFAHISGALMVVYISSDNANNRHIDDVHVEALHMCASIFPNYSCRRSAHRRQQAQFTLGKKNRLTSTALMRPRPASHGRTETPPLDAAMFIVFHRLRGNV
ncbi:MAG: hypothetical protein QM813_12365 [Verrucomicrobiota bacterium]